MRRIASRNPSSRLIDSSVISERLVRFAPELHGHVSVNPAELAARADDFGHIVSRAPAAVVRPSEPEQVRQVVRFARSTGVTVAARGRGHSTGGQAQAEDGIVIDMTGLNAVTCGEGRSAWAQAGATWGDVATHALARGLVPPVMPDYPDLSVGGTLSVGGIGPESLRWGTLADSALELNVVTGAGELITCSERHHQDLFHGVLAGLGQLAIIVSARLQLVAALPQATQFRLLYERPTDLIRDLGRLTEVRTLDGLQGSGFAATRDALRARFGGVAQDLVGDRILFMIEATRYHGASRNGFEDHFGGDLCDVRRYRYLIRMSRMQHIERLSQLARRTDLWRARHPGTHLILPADRTEAVIDKLLGQLRPADLGEGRLLIHPLRRGPIGVPLMRTPDARDLFVLALEQHVPQRDDLNDALDRHRWIRQLGTRFGGHRYLIDFPLSTEDEARAHFGEHWEQFVALKERYDRLRLLAPSQGVFAPATPQLHSPDRDPVKAR